MHRRLVALIPAALALFGLLSLAGRVSANPLPRDDGTCSALRRKAETRTCEQLPRADQDSPKRPSPLPGLSARQTEITLDTALRFRYARVVTPGAAVFPPPADAGRCRSFVATLVFLDEFC